MLASLQVFFLPNSHKSGVGYSIFILMLQIGNGGLEKLNSFPKGYKEVAKLRFESSSVSKAHTSVQFSSVAQSWTTLGNPMDGSMPGFPVHQQHPELAQIHVHWGSDAIQSSYSMSSPSFSSCLQSFPASGSFPMTQFFTSGGQSIGVSASASVLPMNIQDWFPLGWTGWISLQSKGP